MHPQTTNIATQTRDVCRFGFESAGALEFANEYSGLAVAPAHLYDSKHDICIQAAGGQQREFNSRISPSAL